MIHQVKASPEDVDKLTQIVGFQLRLLRSAIDHPNLSVEFLAQYLQPRYGDNTDEVTRWVFNKPALVGYLNRFSMHNNPDEKRNFIDRLEADINLLSAPQAARFQTAFSQDMPDWQKAVSDFFIWFYDRWGSESGFPSCLFIPEPLSRKSYTRWDFIDGFSKHNERLYLCAICDATAYRATIDSRAYTSIEHFFPKSIYPHLVLHPYNLIPICTFCNSGAARSLDPLDYCSQELGITELLLPYQTEAGLSELAYIEVQTRTDAQGKNLSVHPLEIHIKPARDRESQCFIERFERIYKIENRWNADLDQIDQHVFRRMTQFLVGDVQLGNDLSDVDFLVGRLELLMALTSKESLGQDPFGFATIWLIRHHIDQIKQDRAASPIYNALKDWAIEQQKQWQTLKTHVKELYDRIPVQEGGVGNLEEQFHHAMIGVADFANQHKFGFRFRQIIDEYGAVEAAKRLLTTREIQTGLMRLWELKSLSKSMEALVIQERFQPLFTPEEIAEARRRLDELGYFEAG